MSKSIKKLTTFLDNRLISLDLQGNKFVQLSGSKIDKDSIIYTLERFLALDFQSYYDDIDSNLGVNYQKSKGTSSLQFNSGILQYSSGKLEKKGLIPDAHCIRYLTSDRIRSFTIDNTGVSDTIGCNMTVFNSVISDSKWNRLTSLVNSLVGYEVVKLDLKLRKLRFDIHEFDGWSVEAIQLVYLILAESMLIKTDKLGVLLLSDIDILSETQLVKFFDVLNRISNIELIIFSNPLSNCESFGGYKVLNLTI